MCQRLHILGFALLSAMFAFSKMSYTTTSGEETDSVESELSRGIIRLDVVVNDRAGNPVSGLKPDDFTLFDNGQAQKIVSFELPDKKNASFEAVFLIDSLNLSPQQLATEKSEIAKFLRENGGHLAYPTMVYRLSSFGLTASEKSSTDGNALADEVVKDREPKSVWTTPIHPEGAPRDDEMLARMEASLKALGAIAIEERKRPDRKLLFWVGPGWPVEQGGHYSFKQIVELSTRLREARVSVFSVTAWAYPKREFMYEEYLQGVRSEKDARAGDVALEVLSTRSGGVVTAPAMDLKGTIERYVKHANDFYNVSFDPPKAEHPDEYHELTIMVNRRDATVRTNSEYYDQPSYNDQPAALHDVNVGQLQSDLAGHQGQTDAELARYLSTIELTERLDRENLAKAVSLMRGPRSKEALVDLADQSAFLPPPTLPQYLIPDPTEQTTMVHRLRQYLTEAIPNQPNLFAKRTTVRYSEPRQKDELAWKTIPIDQSLHPFGVERLTVLVRNSKEITEKPSTENQATKRERNLFSEGAFGPILLMVSRDIIGAGSKMEWSRWEEANGRRIAVFRFTVRRASDDFEVGFCCLLEPNGTLPYKRRSAYHGEMTVDPQSGAMLHIWIESDLPPRLPIIRAAFMVDFGPVVVGGKTYLCPTKSVYISRARTVKMLREWDQTFAVFGPFQTLLNDVTFSNYHAFRSEHRILTDYSPVP